MAGGGTLVVLPVMVFMGIPGNVANGTNRIAMFPQNITAVSAFLKKGVSNFRLSLSLGLASLPGAIIGAYVGTQLEGQRFNVILAIVMVAVMILMLMPSKNNKTISSDQSSLSNISAKQNMLGHFLMLFVGFWGGFIMAGVGFLMIAVLNKVMSIDLVSANAHKVFIEIIYSIFALAIFSSQLQLLWTAGLILGFGCAIGAWFGANYQVKKGAESVKKVLIAVLTVFIIKLIFFPN